MRLVPIILISYLLFTSCTPSSETKLAYDKPQNVNVNGKILNTFPAIENIRVAINRVGFGQEEIESEIDSTGNFSFQFETYIPTDAWLIYQSNVLFIVEPGDSLYIEFDGSKSDRTEILESMLFKGDRAITNNQISSFQAAYYESRIFKNWDLMEKAIKSRTPDQFKYFADSIRSEGKQFYNEFINTNSIDEEAKNWAQFFLDHEYYSDLTFYPESHRKALVLKQSEWDVPISYYDYLNEYIPISKSLGSGYSIFGFADKYLYRYIRLRANKKMGENSEIILEQHSKDSILLQTIVAHTSDQLLKQILITQYCNALLAESNIDSFEKNIEFIRSNISSAFLREPLFKTYEKIKLIITESELPTKTRIERLDTKSKIALIKNITKDYKGKPLYIDIWATWCKPCLEEFPYSKKLQEELKDVTFVFLCIDSDEVPFKNTLKKFQLEGVHYYLNTNQSKELRNEFKIVGIPHYILVDKTGVIIYEGYKLRPSEDKIKEEIRELLLEGANSNSN